MFLRVLYATEHVLACSVRFIRASHRLERAEAEYAESGCTRRAVAQFKRWRDYHRARLERALETLERVGEETGYDELTWEIRRAALELSEDEIKLALRKTRRAIKLLTGGVQ